MNSRKDPDWEWYRSFLSVLELGSLSGAARALGVGQPTIGRHVEALEKALALKLFTRSSDGFAPTDAALELQPYAANLGATAAALRRSADSYGEGVRGTVRITASDVIGVEVLPPILTNLRRAHPQLNVELMLSNELEDLLHREADIAVRMVPPSQQALLARRIGGIELGLYAHRDYLDRAGTPTTLQELGSHAVIGFDRENDITRRLEKRFKAFARSSFALRTDNNLAQLAAIRAAFGIGFCQSALAKRDPNLVRVLPRRLSLAMDTWIAMHEDLRDNPRCSVTFTALADGISAYIKSQ